MTTKTAWYTKLLIWVLASVAIGIDIWLAVNHVRGDTISEVSQAYAWKWATIPVAYGVLTGHLFWPAFGEFRWKWPRIIALWVLAAVLIVLDAVDLYDVVPILPLAPSIALGRLLWPQSVSIKQALFTWKRDGSTT